MVADAVARAPIKFDIYRGVVTLGERKAADEIGVPGDAGPCPAARTKYPVEPASGQHYPVTRDQPRIPGRSNPFSFAQSIAMS